MFHTSRFRWLSGFAAVIAVLAIGLSQVDARVGAGGSRGMRTFSAPPVTRTAPNTAAPIERSMMQPTRPSTVGAAPAATAPGGLFQRPGFLGGLFTGFLGAGLLGMLFGHGPFGGLGGFASVVGLLLQVALIVIVGRLLWAWWQRRNANAYAAAGGPSLRDLHPEAPVNRAGGGGFAGADAIRLDKPDFDDFERLLADIQLAYGREDLAGLRQLATPEMVSYFAEDLAKNASRGVVNEIGGVKLLQGDLAEAWREGDTDYATVAMRYVLADAMIDRATGAVVEGSREPQEVTEVWTFLRSRGGHWVLSAIQRT